MYTYLETRDCAPKCKSSSHASELISLLTKSRDTNLLLSALQQCWNCHKIHDNSRRYLLHMSSSCGLTEVVEWLINYRKAEMNVRTLENNWTPAHCAAFYGNIGTLVSLVKLGASISSLDDDKLFAEFINREENIIVKTNTSKHGFFINLRVDTQKNFNFIYKYKTHSFFLK